MADTRILATGALAALLGLSACSTFRAYDGPERPAGEVAALKVSIRVIPLLLVNFISGYTLTRIDDKPLKGTTNQFEPGSHRLSFAPGIAVILAGYGGGGVISPEAKMSCTLTADFQAGHTYRLPPGSLQLGPLEEGSTTRTGTVRLKDSAKGQRTRTTEIPVSCQGGVAGTKRDASTE